MQKSFVSQDTKPRVLKTTLVAKQMRCTIVASKFHHFIIQSLVDAGTIEALATHQADIESQTVIWIPSIWKIPLVAQKAAASGKFDAIICVGAVIKGKAVHFKNVVIESTNRLKNLKNFGSNNGN